MSDTFCPIPWISYAIRGNGNVRICCHSNQSPTRGILLKEDGTSFKYNDSIDESRNSKTLKSVRLSLLNGKWHSECVRCMREFNSGLITRNRKDAWKWKEYFTEEDARRLTRSDGSIDTSKIPLRHFEVRLGNTCNLKCIMCGPVDSNRWRRDYEFVYGSNTYEDFSETIKQVKIVKDGGKYTVEGESYDWYKNDVFWDELSKHRDGMKILLIGGGEPLIIYEHYDFLDKCIKDGYSKKIRLDYSTNLTVIPKRTTKIWENFECVGFGVSIDGVGKVNDYIRWPSKFSVLEKNIKLLDEAEANYKLWLCYTASVFNILRLPEFVIWKIRQNFKRANPGPNSPFLTIHPLHKPDCMNIKLFPRESVSIIEKSLRKSVRRIADELTKNVALNVKIYSEMIEGYIKFMYQEDYSKLIPKFWSVSNRIDEVRGCKLEDYIPEIIDLLPMR